MRRHQRLLGLGLVAAAAAGCASGNVQREDDPSPGEGAASPSGGKLDPGWRPGNTPVGGGGGDDGMTIAPEKGVLDTRDVDRVMARNNRALVACYARAGAAQKYAAGEVMLRIHVSSAGEVSNVIVTSSALGNYQVERCLVEEGRRLVFPPPRGGRATDFEFSLLFRAHGTRGSLIQWHDDIVARDVAPLARQLPAACGSLGPTPVRAVAYIQPGGSVSSVGLASPGPLDTEASNCVVEQIRKWRLPDDRGHVVRTGFMVSMGAAAPALAPAPPRLVRRMPRRRAR
jgi:TonB family protein